MKRSPVVPILLATLVLGGCAFVPKTNLRLEEARNAHRITMADARIAELAAPELKRASEVLEQAIEAANTLQDPAVVDHLAYIAKQRAAIAQEAARLSAAESAIARANAEHDLLAANATKLKPVSVMGGAHGADSRY